MNDVDTYLGTLSEPEADALQRVRNIVKNVAPSATESISYGVPAFKIGSRPLFYYGAFKDHLSVFPTSGPTDKLHDQLAGYKVSKGTIQFTLEKQLPEELIIDLVKARLEEL